MPPSKRKPRALVAPPPVLAHPDVDLAAGKVTIPLDTHEGRLAAGFYRGALLNTAEPDLALASAVGEALRAARSAS